MLETYTALKHCPLFADISEQEMLALLECLNATHKSYSKGDFIFHIGEKVKTVGVVLVGSVHVVQEDFWGNRTILTSIEPGELFAEAFSCSQTDSLPISVIAAQESKILLIDYKRIITSCSSACGFHTGLIRNMMQILAKNNIRLTQKMEHITQRTTREKLISYLSAQAKLAKSDSFTIPFDRQQLANYLSVDRSALSNELGKMRDCGILSFRKNHFELYKGCNYD